MGHSDCPSKHTAAKVIREFVEATAATAAMAPAAAAATMAPAAAATAMAPAAAVQTVPTAAVPRRPAALPEIDPNRSLHYNGNSNHNILND